MRFCMNQVTFGERDFRAVVEACASAGFEAIEVWLPYIEREAAAGWSVEEARTLLDDHGVRAAAACYVDGLFGRAGDGKREAFDAAKARFELAQALGADLIACVGNGPADPTPDDYEHAADRAREMGDLAASFGLGVAVEFVAGLPFLGTLATAARLVERADHADVGLLFDCFHFYAGRSKLADFRLLGRHGIALVHLTDARDVPRETLRDGDRVLPGDGCFPLADLLARVERSGFDGYYSVELFNAELFAQEPAAVATKARGACDALAQRMEQAPPQTP